MQAIEIMTEKVSGKPDQIYETLRRAIVRLEMEPGSAISEKELCGRFEVSRTPVREALQRLAEEDLVDIHPHSGTWVSRISFVLRRALEVESVRRAAALVTEAGIAELDGLIARMRLTLRDDRPADYLEVDDAFHAAIARISAYPRIWKFIGLAKVQLDRMRQLSAPVPGHLAEVTEQHAAIVQALARRNAMQAELAMRIHLDSSFEVMAAIYPGQPAMFAEASNANRVARAG